MLDHRDDEASKLGMWIFLFTEILLFGGLFIVYAVFRDMYPHQFSAGANQLNSMIGAFNTIILLVSSATAAMSITAVQKGNNKLALILLAATILVGVIFMVNKYFEWSAKIHHGIYPNSDALFELPKGYLIFFGLYYFMTGLHALHIIIGVTFITVVMAKIKKNKINSGNYVLLENAGLYWHLVDLIWIFLFPLFYLIS